MGLPSMEEEIIILATLQNKAINQWNINHMDIEKNNNTSMWFNILHQHEC